MSHLLVHGYTSVAWERFQVQIDKSHFEQKTQSLKQLLTYPNFNVGTVVNIRSQSIFESIHYTRNATFHQRFTKVQ